LGISFLVANWRGQQEEAGGETSSQSPSPVLIENQIVRAAWMDMPETGIVMRMDGDPDAIS
jgi:hypothetical protein